MDNNFIMRILHLGWVCFWPTSELSRGVIAKGESERDQVVVIIISH